MSGVLFKGSCEHGVPPAPIGRCSQCPPDTRTRVHAIVSEHLCVVHTDVADDKTFAALGADSLDSIELAMAFEDAFDVQIGDDTITETTTVGDAVEAIEALL